MGVHKQTAPEGLNSQSFIMLSVRGFGWAGTKKNLGRFFSAIDEHCISLSPIALTPAHPVIACVVMVMQYAVYLVTLKKQLDVCSVSLNLPRKLRKF